jgi:hypothetical protein
MAGRPGDVPVLSTGRAAHARSESGTAPAERVDELPAVCRCHRPLSAPDGPHWWPHQDAEPPDRVGVVAIYGEDPGFLRRVRVAGGWRTMGSGACHAGSGPPRPWEDLGACWAGAIHPVVDVTGWDRVSESAEKSA